MGSDTVLAYAHNYRAALKKLRIAFLKGTGLLSASRRIVFGLKVQNYLFTSEFFQTAHIAVLIRQAE
jgi:hypothetical protein